MSLCSRDQNLGKKSVDLIWTTEEYWMMEEYEERDLVSEDEYDKAVEEMNRVLGKRKALLSRSGMAGLGRLGLNPSIPKTVVPNVG